MGKEYTYLVAMRCFTYNHALYIEDALRGFAMQETTFPVVYIVVDDASTDGEPEVLRKWVAENLESEDGAEAWKDMPYGQLSVANLKGKSLSTFVILLLNENHYSIRKSKFPYIEEWNEKAKYFALCEGDDYWTNRLHLESRVSFLEQHDEVGMCYSKCSFYYEKERRFDKKPWGGRGESFEELIKENSIPTLSVVYRRNLDQKYLEYRESCQGSSLWTMGDYPRWLWFSANSRVCFFNTVDGVYRVLPESASHSSDIAKRVKFIQSYCAIRSRFCDDFASEKQKKNLNKLVYNQCNWNLLTVYVKNGLGAEARLYHKKIVIYNVKSFAQYLLGYLMINISCFKIIKP